MLLSAYPVQRAPAVCGVWGNMSVASFTLACAMQEDRNSTCCSLHFQKKNLGYVYFEYGYYSIPYRICFSWTQIRHICYWIFTIASHICLTKPLGSWTIGNYQSNFQPHLTAVLEFAIVCFTKSSIYYLSKNITTTSIYCKYFWNIVYS